MTVPQIGVPSPRLMSLIAHLHLDKGDPQKAELAAWQSWYFSLYGRLNLLKPD